MRSRWNVAPAGRSGKMISTLLSHMVRHVADKAFVLSMTSRTNTHGPGCTAMNTCFTREGFPSAGAWTRHGLGPRKENLPTLVALQDIRGEPPNGPANWGNGLLPAQHQAVVLAAQQPLRNLARPGSISEAEEAATRALLARANAGHAEAHPGNSELRARIAADELAARMQLAAPEVCDLSREAGARGRALWHERRECARGELRTQLSALAAAPRKRRALRESLLRLAGECGGRVAQLPATEERAVAVPLIATHGWAAFCRALLNMNALIDLD